MKTARWNHLKSLKTAHRLLLSGTPVQNNLRELLVLLDFLSPHVFKFKASSGGRGGWGDDEQSDPIGELLLGLGLGEDGKAPASSGAQGLAAVRQVRTLLAPFVLRRLKAQVLLQLAAKTTVEVVLAAEPSQQRVYDGILRRHVAKQQRALAGATKGGKASQSAKAVARRTQAAAEAETLADSGDEGGDLGPGAGPGPGGGGAVDEAQLAALVGCDRDAKHVFTELRKAANHPLLLREHYRDPATMATLATKLFGYGHFGDTCSLAMVRAELDGYSDLDLHALCASYGGSLQRLELPVEALFESAKMRWLRDHVPPMLSQGHRVLVFSQWTSLLSALELLFAHLGVGFLRLDGSTPVPERQALIDEFNADRSKGVFLLSTRAGGLGINLTSADTVVMHDLDFNPVNDRQAEDRCHRIGQTKPVTVYKLVTAGTVDANILELGKRKTEVNSALLDDGASSGQGAGSGNELQSMSAMLKVALKSFLN
jgi:SWI/SNF-related matrix-associated actin-dependent regulator 1 of chromatin subfamily A